jgi:altronate dehydratase small subunit
VKRNEASKILVIDDADNVATTLVDFPAGADVVFTRLGEPSTIVLIDDIPSGHKFAIDVISSGDAVKKYGVVIARAMVAIKPGEHVHVHNIESNRGRGDRS